MFSFRQKIFISYIIVFLVFIALIFPFATYTVRKIATKAMEDRAKELIAKIESAPNDDALIRRLKEQKPQVFFRVSVINNDSKIIYDSHTKRLLGPRFSQEYVVDHPEVIQAFKNGIGYNEDYSELLEQKFSFFAKAFDFHGKTYVMRTAFPYKYVAELTHDCEIGFLGLATIILLLFSVLTWFVINHLTSPIHQIINAVTPYQEGKQATIPEIKLKSSNTSDEFGKLAMTLNSLSYKIQKHIDTIISERNEKSAILESLVEGVVGVDDNAAITYANDMALKLLGFDQQILLGQNFNTINQPTCYALLMACQREKRPLTDTLTITGKNNSKTFLDILAAPKGQKSGAILVMQDQTSHYRLLEMRKDFIANASHELKTPITIIRGFAEALHDNPDLSQETRNEITAKIVKSCKRMTSLIKDLLTLSDIENIPQSKLMECDVYDIIQTCSNNLHDAFSDAQIIIQKQSEGEMNIIADPSLIELAIMNLIENGIKYSTPPAQITISLEKINNNIQITIADKGIGISQADLEHIFERFYTVDKAHSQKMGGSGLGLSIVQTIIHKHFGHITVDSELGKGTSFTILLPCSDQLSDTP